MLTCEKIVKKSNIFKGIDSIVFLERVLHVNDFASDSVEPPPPGRLNSPCKPSFPPPPPSSSPLQQGRDLADGQGCAQEHWCSNNSDHQYLWTRNGNPSRCGPPGQLLLPCCLAWTWGQHLFHSKLPNLLLPAFCCWIHCNTVDIIESIVNIGIVVDDISLKGCSSSKNKQKRQEKHCRFCSSQITEKCLWLFWGVQAFWLWLFCVFVLLAPTSVSSFIKSEIKRCFRYYIERSVLIQILAKLQ